MNHLKSGLVLLVISIFLLPTSLFLMDKWDESETEYRNNCDPLVNPGPKDGELCSELEYESNLRLTFFFISTLSFIITGVSGLVSLLPEGDEKFNPPPSGKF